jgi:hypothetical protein
MAEHQTDGLLEGASNLQAAIRDHFIAKLPALIMSSVAGDLSALVARFVLERQTEALRAAVVLAENSLGHLALPLVRPACEERIWAAYLYSLERGARERLLFHMSIFESANTVNAQQQFLGSKAMRRLGFPKSFVTAQSRLRKEAGDGFERIGQDLGWPAEARPLPSLGWIASHTSLDSLYSFLYAASSKGVHFSPGEVLRSGWSQNPGPDAPVTLMAEPYVEYRTAFSIHWMSSLLIDTVLVLVEHGPLSGMQLDEGASEVIGSAAQQIGSAGRPPIALAAEFNLKS